MALPSATAAVCLPAAMRQPKGQKTLAGIFAKIKDCFKPFRAAIVGVGHFMHLLCLAKRGQQPDFVLVFRWTQGAGRAFVVGIHHKDPVKPGKIAAQQLPCALARQVVATCPCVLLAACIRREANVIVVGAG